MDAAEEAMDQEYDGNYDIWGGDSDPKAIAIARSNAEKAGVEDLVRFEGGGCHGLFRSSDYGQLVTNPPYGERLLEQGGSRAALPRFLGRPQQRCRKMAGIYPVLPSGV